MTIPKLPFGRPGHQSTRLPYSVAPPWRPYQQDDADRTLEVLLQHGINHIDVAASYGEAELRIAPWMPSHRNDFFLATKTGERAARRAGRAASLARPPEGRPRRPLAAPQSLGPDPVGYRAQPWRRDRGRCRGPRARADPLHRGHGHGTQVAAAHRRSLLRFDFDSVLLPYNYLTLQNSYYAENFNALHATCQERNIAVQTIKSIAYRPWMGQEHTRSPGTSLEEQQDIDMAVWWVL